MSHYIKKPLPHHNIPHLLKHGARMATRKDEKSLNSIASNRVMIDGRRKNHHISELNHARDATNRSPCHDRPISHTREGYGYCDECGTEYLLGPDGSVLSECFKIEETL